MKGIERGERDREVKGMGGKGDREVKGIER